MYAHHTPSNEREEQARRLGLQLKKFERLVNSANHAYDVIKELGPFYGNGIMKDPTFRITAEPVTLPKGSKEILTTFGNDLYHLAKALQVLPEKYKKDLGSHLDYRIPPTWRIDAIIDQNGILKVNEIEGVDSANALMMAEQQAYNLQSLQESTAGKIIQTFKEMSSQKKKNYKLAFIRVLVPYNPHTPNHERLINFLKVLSQGTIEAELLDESNIRAGLTKPNWKDYDGIINHTSLTPNELYALGVTEDQLFASGNYNALVNKGVFALLFDEELVSFWSKQLGEKRYKRITDLLIPSRFIRSVQDLENAHKSGKVVKVSWAGKNITLINRSKGVAMPVTNIEQGTDERWETLKKLFVEKVTLIAQDFVMPAKLPSLLRKKGTMLEFVEWYNRVCVKYVAESNPNTTTIPTIALTATEVTLGPDIIPAGRKCAFTAGKLV